MNARCKFSVQSVKHFGSKSFPMIEVELSPVCSSDIPEDKAFTKATPSGSFKFTTTNAALFDTFEPGKKFYVDLTEAAE